MEKTIIETLLNHGREMHKIGAKHNKIMCIEILKLYKGKTNEMDIVLDDILEDIEKYLD
jgi:hypothetical protein